MRSFPLLKLFQLLLVTCMIGILIFRIIVWIVMYNDSSTGIFWSSMDEVAPSNESQLNDANKHFYITLCNVNIARASKVFNESFSLDFFDIFSQSAFLWQQDPNQNSLPNHNVLNSSAHEMKDMLKMCQINSRVCSHKNFNRHLTKVGICYSSLVKITKLKSVKLVLDPEEFDYLLPNHGLVGFTLYIHSRGLEDSQSFLQNMIPIGPGFETIVQIKTKRSSTNICRSQLLCLIRRNCEKSCLRNEVAVIPGMITQAMRQPYYMQLVTHAFLKDFNHHLLYNRVSLGLSLQQRSYLHAANKTLFSSISSLAIYSVGALRKFLTKIDSIMKLITNMGSSEHVQEEECAQALSLPLSRLILMARDYLHTRKTKDILEGHHIVTSRHSQLYVIHCFFSGQRLNSPIQYFLKTNVAVLSNFKIQLQNRDIRPFNIEAKPDCLTHRMKQRLRTLTNHLVILEIAIVHFLDQLKNSNSKLYEMAIEQRTLRVKFPSFKEDKIKLSPERLVSVTLIVDKGIQDDAAPITDLISNQIDLGNLINSLLTTVGFCLICIMFLSKTCDKRVHKRRTLSLRPPYRSVNVRPRMTDLQSTEQFSDTSAS